MDAQKESTHLEFGAPVVVASLKSAAADEFVLDTHALGVQARSLNAPVEETTSPLLDEAELQDEQPIDAQGDDSFDSEDTFDVLCALVDAATRVCVILVHADSKYVPVATGFHVGEGFLLTAKHVIAACVAVVAGTPGTASDFVMADSSEYDEHQLSKMQLFANFEYENDINNEKNIPLKLSSRITIAEHFHLDAIFLELDKPHDMAKGFSPESLDFGDSESPKCVHLIGHFNGEKKSIDRNCKVEQVRYAQDQLKKYYKGKWRGQLTIEPDNENWRRDEKLVQDGQHVLINCWFLHGASGSPMLHYCDGKAKVVAVFCCGLPSGHYPRRKKQPDGDAFDKSMRKNYGTFEAGLKLSSIRDAMSLNSRMILGW